MDLTIVENNLISPEVIDLVVPPQLLNNELFGIENYSKNVYSTTSVMNNLLFMTVNINQKRRHHE